MYNIYTYTYICVSYIYIYMYICMYTHIETSTQTITRVVAVVYRLWLPFSINGLTINKVKLTKEHYNLRSI